MTIDTNDLLDSIMASLSRIENIDPDTMPDIDLYMDQVTTFMDSHLGKTKRHEDDKILTKTMINNYAKNKLLPPPNKKKYSKEHMLTLIFIYYFKNTLSISDIQSILNPLTDRYFGKKSSPTLEEIYNVIFKTENDLTEHAKERIRQDFMASEEAIKQLENIDEEDREFLRNFIFICLLNFDVYTKKLLIEKIIDSMKKPSSSKNNKKH